VSRDAERESPTLVTDGGESTVHHVVCRDCGMDRVYESQLRAGIEMAKHILATRHVVVVEELAGE
jgi:Fe2+ or Zn2+ uptake regulation protein